MIVVLFQTDLGYVSEAWYTYDFTTTNILLTLQQLSNSYPRLTIRAVRPARTHDTARRTMAKPIAVRF